MKYFLGFKDSNGYHKIDKTDFKGSIRTIVDYTTSFIDELHILDDLLNKNLIENKRVKLYYLIEKKGILEPLKESNKIYTCLSVNLFNREGIRKFIYDGINDDEFLNYLFKCILNKYGYLTSIKEFLYDNSNNEVSMLKLLKEMINVPTYIGTKNILKKLIDIFTSNSYQGDEVDLLIQDLVCSIGYDNVTYINIYKWSKKYIKFPNIPTLYYMEELYNGVIYTKDSYSFSFETNELNSNVISLINIFVDSLLYTYDKSTRQYKKDFNGNIKIQERGLFYLGAILDRYQEYMICVVTETKCVNEEITDEDKEEFLEEEDFERLGTTSVEQGIKLRERKDN